MSPASIPGHDVGPRHADQIGCVLCAEHGVRAPRTRCTGLAAGAADHWTAQQSGELALDQSGCPRRELDVTAHDLDERVDLDAHCQGGRGRGRACVGGSARSLHVAGSNRSVRNTRNTRNAAPLVQTGRRDPQVGVQNRGDLCYSSTGERWISAPERLVSANRDRSNHHGGRTRSVHS